MVNAKVGRTPQWSISNSAEMQETNELINAQGTPHKHNENLCQLQWLSTGMWVKTWYNINSTSGTHSADRDTYNLSTFLWIKWQVGRREKNKRFTFFGSQVLSLPMPLWNKYKHNWEIPCPCETNTSTTEKYLTALWNKHNHNWEMPRYLLVMHASIQHLCWI